MTLASHNGQERVKGGPARGLGGGSRGRPALARFEKAEAAGNPGVHPGRPLPSTALGLDALGRMQFGSKRQIHPQLAANC